MAKSSMKTPFTPIDQPGPDYADFFGLLVANAARYPDKDAVIIGEERLDWAAFLARVQAACGRLHALGLRPGDRLAMLSEPSVEFLVSFVAGLACGGCVVPLPAIVSDKALGRVLVDCGAGIVLVSSAMADRIPALDVSELQAFGLDAPVADWSGFDTVTPAPWVYEPVPQDSLFNIIYSSGTTGTPKGIVHDQLYRFRQLQRMRALGVYENAITLVATATYSNTTLTPVIATLGNGGTLIMMPKFTAEAYLSRVKTERPSHTMIVPIQIQRILEHPSFETSALESLQATVITSSPWPLSIKEQAVSAWPGKLLEMYGMTEGGLTTVLDTKAFPEKLGTVGKPSPLADVRIVDEQGAAMPVGETGEIIGRSPTMMNGYFGRPDLTINASIELADGLTYFRSGDLGRFDADGFLTLSGRSKDVIISGGFNIYAIDLEEVLFAHPQIVEAAVIGVPDKKWGETPVAYVVADRNADAEALREGANGELGRVQHITALQIVDELPRNALGKVQKNDLRASWINEHGEN